ncbi:MAG: Na/Pi cotransporter family protein, partial [Gammaproteobacteria bacterium]
SPFVEAAAIPIALSLFHTFFNIINTLLLIGFIKQIAKIVEWMVPAVIEEEAEIDQPRFLSPSSLVYPQTGIKALFDESLRLLQDAAYKAITHGLSVHREDLESDVKLKSMLESKETIPVDIERIYATKIKSVYSKILEYATILQSKFALEKNKIETIRNILIADRMLVLVVKRMVPLHKNIVRALSSNNHALLQEYNQIRRKILKVIRQIHRASLSDQPVKYIEKIEKQKAKAEELDVLLSGHVNKLVLDGAITNDMATSLMNDSEEAQHIVRDLVDIATLLYYPRDELIDQIEEQELELRATS